MKENHPPPPLRIGISACFFHADPQRAVFKGKTLQYLEQSIAHWLMSDQSAATLAYLIPSPPAESPISLQHYAQDLDALVLEGGSDVAPETYGETPLRPEWKGDRVRDLYEIALFKAFLKEEKPILGVCRGLQLINVALGGSLYQDIELQVKGSLTHRNWDIYDQLSHEIELGSQSLLTELFKGPSKVKVNSVHHQGIKDLAKGLKIEAHSPSDGIIEAIRMEGPSFVYGVQWHPEFHDPRDPSWLDSKRLLNHFLNRVRQTKINQNI